MRVVAWAATLWAAQRWLGVLLGVFRTRAFPKGPVRREAVRTVVTSAALTVLVSVVALLCWTAATDRQLTEEFGGLLGAAVMISLAVALAATLMQPTDRTAETLGLTRVLRPRRPRDEH